jgi:asparagine synthase (glutamine-hydrolysing)
MAYRLSGNQRQRGPDYTGLWLSETNDVAMIHERLAIQGVKTGDQPLKSDDGRIILTANGEIYNYLTLAQEINEKRQRGQQVYTAKSDCDVIIALYEQYGLDLLKKISGMFAFLLYDSVKNMLLVARDPIGIIPLYKGE